jgi:predicted membrane protein
MEKQNTKFGNSFWIGIIILAIGALILLDRMDYDLLPYWLFSWKTLLIAIGVTIGLRKNFQGIGWLVLIVVGGFFLIEDIPGVDFNTRRFLFPVVLIAVGLLILFRSVFSKSGEVGGQWLNFNGNKKDGYESAATGDESVNITSVFGGTKRRIFSKNFGGGQITSIFGGSEIDLTQADINGTIRIDMVSIFGGAKLLVPSNWEIKSDITAILGGVEDKRKDPTLQTPEKKIVLTGVVIFGGVDIKSY